MASDEWYLPGSDSESEKNTQQSGSTCLELGGIRIPPWRFIELMQMVEQKRTVELDSVSEAYRLKKLKKKKKKSKKKKKKLKCGRGLEEVSETASEIRSTTCTSTTATECRDPRRPNLQKFDCDPELDDDGRHLIPELSLSSRKKKAPPPSAHKKVQQLARLDKITADEYVIKQRWKKSQQELTERNLNSTHVSSNNHFGISSLLDTNSIPSNLVPSNSVPSGVKIPVANAAPLHQGQCELLSFGEESEDDKSMAVRNETLSFIIGDLDDSSSTSESDMKISLLSQIDKVDLLNGTMEANYSKALVSHTREKQLLDSDGLS